MVEILSEYLTMTNKIVVKEVDRDCTGSKTPLFEVIYDGKSIGVYRTKIEAESIAKNYALGSSISRT